MAWLKVPYDKEWNDTVCPLWRVGFENIFVDESDIDQGIVYFQYETDLNGSQWDDYSVIVDINKKTVKGFGSRKHRKFILESVLFWYLKAKNEKGFDGLMN